MKKTISINLAGIVFNIDDDAFNKLDRYLKVISGYFSDEDGKKEIMTDIESRIAEMFQERMAKSRNVISEEDVDYVISVMGQPEDYIQDDSQRAEAFETDAEPSNRGRRLFRDADDKMIGGVCSGIGHYFGLDPIIFRILFFVALVFFGTGVLLYVILWAFIPAAVTASEKLQMRGKPINVDSITRRVQEEADYLKKKVEDSRKDGNWLLQIAEEVTAILRRIIVFLASIFTWILKSVGNFIGFIILFSSIVFLILFAAILFGTDGSVAFVINDLSIQSSIRELSMFIFEDQNHYTISSLGLLLSALLPISTLIAFAMLLMRSKRKFKFLLIGSLACFIVGAGLITYSVTKTQRQFWADAKVESKMSLSNTQSDTLYVVSSESPLPWYDRNQPFIWNIDGDEAQLGNIHFEIQKSHNDSTFLRISKRARGYNLKQAAERSENIDYQFNMTDNKLSLSPYFSIYKEDKWRGQELELILFVPEGKSVALDDGAKLILRRFKSTNPSTAIEIWKMTAEGFICENC